MSAARRPPRRVALAACALLLTACVTRTIQSAVSDVSERVPFLRPGETGLREAFDRLGEPAHHHVADGVYVWNAGFDQDGRLRVLESGAKPVVISASWRSGLRELVLQFDAAGTYVRGSLVHAE